MAFLDLEGLKHLGQRLGAVFVRKDQLVNHLTAIEEGFALDARQGKALQDAINGKAAMAQGTLTLSSDSWSSSDGAYVQTVSYAGAKANNALIVAAAPSSYKTYAENMVYCNAQAEGSLTFTATVKPTSNLTVNILSLE